MIAGNALDVIVANKVMGWIFDGVGWRDGDAHYGINALPRVSTEPGYMWMVVERMERLGHEMIMSTKGTRQEGSSVAYIVSFGGKDNEMTADTAALAICLAALKVLKQL